MKITRTISVELETWTEFIKQTKAGDYSAIIDGLIAAYVSSKTTAVAEMEKEQLQAEINAQAVKMAEMRKKIESLEAKEAEDRQSTIIV